MYNFANRPVPKYRFTRLSPQSGELIQKILIELRGRAQDCIAGMEDGRARAWILDDIDRAGKYLSGYITNDRVVSVSMVNPYDYFVKTYSGKAVRHFKNSADSYAVDTEKKLAQFFKAMIDVVRCSDKERLETPNTPENITMLADKFFEEARKDIEHGMANAK